MLCEQRIHALAELQMLLSQPGNCRIAQARAPLQPLPDRRFELRVVAKMNPCCFRCLDRRKDIPCVAPPGYIRFGCGQAQGFQFRLASPKIRNYARLAVMQKIIVNHREFCREFCIDGVRRAEDRPEHRAVLEIVKQPAEGVEGFG